jgi:hypothetical protein
MEEGNNYKLTLATLVERLRNTILAHQRSEFGQTAEPLGHGEWQPLPNASSVEQAPSIRHIAEIVQELDRALRNDGYPINPSKEQPSPDEYWTFGSEIITFPIRSIYVGFVEPVLHVPIVRHIPESVVAFLLAIPGERDVLKREHHGQVGWHYHYLDVKRRRSNVVLCWDTRAARENDKDHPLFQEHHGEGHAEFGARPDLWGPTKKESMHGACAPDLDTWPLPSFRCASSKAGPVWPLSAKVTPIVAPSPPSTKSPSASSTKAGKSHR